ncbi:HdeD family acid-resistance protein [uncultured Duncaniella sp.]|uniref:HdeD family acid-resistance protein n=2 Tax=uncultured Duncaniella sp. TaxID=2768039 RepID=UPI00264762CF|nr:DUF308 domain-containing protein [uncultured Duncaniella sp.]
MKALFSKFMGESRYWWVVLLAGILMVICGFAYWFWPVVGYAVASQLFGWLLIVIGVVQLLQASGPHAGRGLGWWLAGGIIDMFIGFMMVRSVVISEAVFPYFLAFIFIFWGISALCAAVKQSGRRYWWLQLINGMLLMLIGFFFIEAGWVQDMAMTSFLTSLAFIYWGFSLAMLSYDIKPDQR